MKLSLMIVVMFAQLASFGARGDSTVQSIKAKLFDFEKASFTDDIIKTQNYGNVPTHANGLMVIVEATVGGGQSLNILLTEMGKKSRVVGRGVFKNAYGTKFFPVFTNDFGCSPLKITVSVIDHGKSTELKTETIPFICHE